MLAARGVLESSLCPLSSGAEEKLVEGLAALLTGTRQGRGGSSASARPFRPARTTDALPLEEDSAGQQEARDRCQTRSESVRERLWLVTWDRVSK